ncbi:HAD-IIA family hydrolase [soil metagenome]
MYRAYIFDLDGTLFRGESVIPGAVETVLELERRGALIRYLTNNSTQTQDTFTKKLNRMGFPAKNEEVYSSGLGTAKYLLRENLRRVYVIGEDGLRHILQEHGIEVAEEGVDAVVVGLSKSFNYHQMNHAMQLIRAGARFVATNPDPTYPVEGGGLIPGAGSVVAAVTACSQVDPFVVGKPNPFLTQLVMEESGLLPADTLVVGDRIDTDLESGRRAGCPTFLVLSGVTLEAPAGFDFAADVTGLL